MDYGGLWLSIIGKPVHEFKLVNIGCIYCLKYVQSWALAQGIGSVIFLLILKVQLNLDFERSPSFIINKASVLNTYNSVAKKKIVPLAKRQNE